MLEKCVLWYGIKVAILKLHNKFAASKTSLSFFSTLCKKCNNLLWLVAQTASFLPEIKPTSNTMCIQTAGGHSHR